MPFINLGGSPSTAPVNNNVSADAEVTQLASTQSTQAIAPVTSTVNPAPVANLTTAKDLSETAVPTPVATLNILDLSTNSAQVISTQQEALEPEKPELMELELNIQPATPEPSVTEVPTFDKVIPVITPAIENSQPAIVASEPILQTKVYNLTDLLQQAIELGASDLHLSAGYRAKVRVHGSLQNINSQLLDSEGIAVMLREVLAPLGHTNLEKDMDLAYQLPNSSHRFRVNIYQQKGTWSAAFRLIPTQISTLEQLKLPSILKEFTKFSNGLVLVTGPTGSGKSSTIAAMINEINQNHACHIVTVEDPVEYVYPNGLALVDQRAVGIDTKDWPTALRGALRQDPDIVMVGEMRDFETIRFAIQLAETGHLVFSTLHTNSAAQTIDRIVDVFPEFQQNQIRTQLSSVLMAVVSQKLIPVNNNSRRVAAEIMVVNPAIRNLIREQKGHQIDNIIQTSAELGMISLEKSLVALVREGLISTTQAQQYANRPDDILSFLGQNNK